MSWSTLRAPAGYVPWSDLDRDISHRDNEAPEGMHGIPVPAMTEEEDAAYLEGLTKLTDADLIF